MTMNLLHTMTGPLTMKVMPLHDPGKPATLTRANNIHLAANLNKRSVKRLARLISIIQPNAGLTRRHNFTSASQRHLHSTVFIILNSPNQINSTRPNLKDRHRTNRAILGIHLRHPNLGGKNSIMHP